MAIGQKSDETPSAVEFTPIAGIVWRVVESQNRISSDRLVDDPDDQPLLEQLIEEVKPPIPPEARHLPTLLATPFRYGHEVASRFRRAKEKPGILYTSEQEPTAVAEKAFYRLKFLSRSPDSDVPQTIVEHTSFTVRTGATRALDLTSPPYVKRRTDWTNPDDYTACQDFAARARLIGTQAIRYESVRDPEADANVAIFDPATVEGESFEIRRSWHFRFEGRKLTAYAAFPSPQHLTFTFEQFGFLSPGPLEPRSL